MTDQIKIDFDAFSRLSPQVNAVVKRLVTDHDSTSVLARANVGGDGQSPSFLAAQRMTTGALPKILGVIGNRMTYHDSPNGTTSTVFQNMPANTTSYGPAVGLVGVQPIGDPGLRSAFDTTSLTPLGAASSTPVVITPSATPTRGEGLPPLPPYPVK